MGDSTGPTQEPGGPDAQPGSGPAIDLTQSEAPGEVFEMMARADALNERLRESGMQLAFALSADGCSLQIELRDLAGNVLRLVSLAEAAQIEARGSVE